WHGVYDLTGSPLASISTMLFMSSGTVYAGTSNNGLYYSTDHGAGWTNIAGLGQINITHLATDPAGNLYAEASSGASVLFRSTDGGSSWTLVGSGLFNGQDEATSFAVNGTYLYAGKSDGVYLSTDNGSTWNLLHNNAISPSSVSALAVDGKGNVFAATNNGVYISNDSGATWNVINKGLTPAVQAPAVGCLAINSDDYMFASTPDNGVYRSVNTTETAYTIQNFWEFLNGPYGTRDSTGTPDNVPFDVTAIANGRDGSVIASVDGNNSQNGEFGLMRTTDNGSSWNWVYKNPGIYALALAPNGTIFAGGDEFLSSTDNGATWSQLTDPAQIKMFAFDSLGNMFIGTGSKGMMRSTDNGNTWTAINQGLPSDQVSSTITVDKNNNIFVASAARGPGGIYRSVDHGNTWISVSYGLPDLGNNAWSLAAGKNGYIYVSYDADFLYSTNEGLVWKVDSSLLNITPRTIGVDPVSGDIFINTGSSVFRSSDNGASWVEADNGVPDSTRYFYGGFSFGSDGHVYAGSYYGVYRSIHISSSDIGTSPTRVTEQLVQVPGDADLNFTVFPNPAQTQATLQFVVPSAARVTVTVSDVLGRTVATLLSGEEHNAGTYQLNYNTSSLLPGMYFCTMREGGIVKMTHLLVTK
ncbi:MAG TPA: T9SS type A sorting domain-containing protein, partial [Candidatus Kapabacteria bacterium]|nr:T9SS type A sorting domain-containing protein [Candidatus Kapabacteria bacterium]